MKGYKQLNQEQRYTIAQLLKRGASLREIARTIVSVSTVSREIKRNKSKYTYRAAYAYMLARERIQWRQHPRLLLLIDTTPGAISLMAIA